MLRPEPGNTDYTMREDSYNVQQCLGGVNVGKVFDTTKYNNCYKTYLQQLFIMTKQRERLCGLKDFYFVF